MAINVEVPVPYAYEHVPRGARKPVTAWVSGSVPYALPDVADAPVAVTMDRVREPFPYYSSKPVTVPETWFDLGGRLARRVAGPDGVPLGPGAIASTDRNGDHAAWLVHGNPFRLAIPHGTVRDDPAALQSRRVVSDGRAAAEAHALEALSRTAIVGGALACPGPEPVWVVRDRHANGYLVIACLERDLDAPGTMGDGHVPFRADRLVEAVAYAEARLAADVESGAMDAAATVVVTGSIRVARPDLLRFDATVRVADTIMSGADRIARQHGFAAAPTPVIAAWLDYRVARDRMAAGDGTAMLAALAALARMREAMPDPIPVPGPGDEPTSLGILRGSLAGLGALVDLLRADAAARATVPEEDAEALASLGGGP